MHRIGRTARGDREGVAYSLFTPKESPMMARGLVRVMRESGQEVDPLLERYAQSPAEPGSKGESREGTLWCHLRVFSASCWLGMFP